MYTPRAVEAESWVPRADAFAVLQQQMFDSFLPTELLVQIKPRNWLCCWRLIEILYRVNGVLLRPSSVDQLPGRDPSDSSKQLGFRVNGLEIVSKHVL